MDIVTQMTNQNEDLTSSFVILFVCLLGSYSQTRFFYIIFRF